MQSNSEIKVPSQLLKSGNLEVYNIKPTVEKVGLEDSKGLMGSSRITASFPHLDSKNQNFRNNSQEIYPQLTRNSTFSHPIQTEMSFGNNEFENRYNKSRSSDFVSENMFPSMNKPLGSLYPDFNTYSIETVNSMNNQCENPYQLSERLNRIRQIL